MESERTGRGPNISSEVKRLIIGQAIHDSKNMPRRALAVRLHDLIERMGEVSPTEDTLARMISEARNKQPSELDQPWSIGACSQYNILPDIIPTLIRLQKLKAVYDEGESTGKITIREAQWVARLYPVAEPVIDRLFKNEEGSLWWLSLIVNGYVQRERVSEQMSEQYPNTSDLDRLYFDSENFLSDGALESWWSTIPLEYQQDIVNAIEQERPILHEDIKRNKGRSLYDEETKMINDCLNVLKSGGPVALREFVNHCPLAQENGMLQIVTSILDSKPVLGGSQ